jgi:hypothetical protein
MHFTRIITAELTAKLGWLLISISSIQAQDRQDDWWSFRLLNRPAIPRVNDKAWLRTPVDSFILATLESKGLRPSPPIDRARLIRRVTYDLLGMPPTPEEIDAFVRDPASNAYEKLIDRLLASSEYGERWGRHWLDVVHYGDTHGYDKDKRRDHAWPYRDYVIRSFNVDKPYSRFVKEQIAGDVIDPSDPDSVIATGFIAAGPWDFVGHVELGEDTVEKKKTRVLDRDDMVANTMSTFISLTAHCARCHDHKFDPISQKDYYSLQADFAGVDRGDRPVGNPPAPTFAIISHPPRTVQLLRRGNVENPKEVAHPGVLAAIPTPGPQFKLSDPQNEGSRRKALADWIADPRNPLTWRSIVNRIWSYHFDRGLVDTPNDFGHRGGLPTHPDLLDWLAAEFRDSGQSIKQLHRLILLSSTYQQSSSHNPAAAPNDSDNRLLWRMNSTRLDAESVRDAVLAVSGTLHLQMGGPGFDLFRFKDDHSPIYDHSAIDKINDSATWRRTVYRFVVRSVPNPFLECLDCADPNINTPVRNTTLTALQALALLNDPFIIKQAECFAERLRMISPDPKAQIDSAYRIALGRAPGSDEKKAMADYVRKHGLANACRLLFNMNEFVFID